MRFGPLLLVIVLGAAGCADGRDDPEESGSTESDLSGTGTCRVLFEDAEIVVLRSQEGKMMYAAKQLHITDVRVTQAVKNTPENLRDSRFASGHIQYTVAGRVSPEALRRAGQALGPGTPSAPVTIDPASAQVNTAILPRNTTTSGNADGSANVELNAEPTQDTSALMDSALRKQLVTSARANSTITCGTNKIALAMNTPRVTFDVNVAKVLAPDVDLAAIDTFLGTANSIRGNAYKSSLDQVNSADLNAKMTTFADIVEREIRPIAQSYGGSMSREELKTRLQNAYNAYRDLSTAVLTITKDTNTIDTVQERKSDGSWGFAENTSPIVTQLLPSANTIRMNVEKSLADSGDGWTTKPLQ
jgi:hypothetical protein